MNRKKTGYYDKNGTEIRDGDIISNHSDALNEFNYKQVFFSHLKEWHYCDYCTSGEELNQEVLSLHYIIRTNIETSPHLIIS